MGKPLSQLFIELGLGWDSPDDAARCPGLGIQAALKHVSSSYSALLDSPAFRVLPYEEFRGRSLFDIAKRLGLYE